MTATVGVMAKDGKKPTSKKRPPSRDKVKYVQIPKEYWDIFHALAQDGEKYEGRSVAYLVKLACRTALQGEGKLDAKGKPIAGAE